MRYIGIDVADIKRAQVVAALDKNFNIDIFIRHVKDRDDVKRLAKDIYERYGNDCIIAIDAPRYLSKGPKNGRQCEREIFRKFYPNVRFQYTPTRKNRYKKIYRWMRVGFWLFEAFGNNSPNVIEVFPSASYEVLKKRKILLKIPLEQIKKGYKKDILDAIISAVTAYFYKKKEYTSYGGGEEGSIIVPK